MLETLFLLGLGHDDWHTLNSNVDKMSTFSMALRVIPLFTVEHCQISLA